MYEEEEEERKWLKGEERRGVVSMARVRSEEEGRRKYKSVFSRSIVNKTPSLLVCRNICKKEKITDFIR